MVRYWIGGILAGIGFIPILSLNGFYWAYRLTGHQLYTLREIAPMIIGSCSFIIILGLTIVATVKEKK